MTINQCDGLLKKPADPDEEEHDPGKKIKLVGADGTTNGLDCLNCFNLIMGSKHRKLFMLWLMDLDQTVLRKSSGAHLKTKLDLLMQIIEGDMKHKVHPSPQEMGFHQPPQEEVAQDNPRHPDVDMATHLAFQKHKNSFTRVTIQDRPGKLDAKQREDHLTPRAAKAIDDPIMTVSSEPTALGTPCGD